MFYSFRADDPGAKPHRLVLFTISKVQVNDLIETVQTYCEEHSPPDAIELIVPDYLKAYFEELASSNDFLDRMPGVSRQLHTPSSQVVTFGVTGFEKNHQRLNQIVHFGLLNLYRRHHGLIESTAGHHYIKPSQKHCSAFLRTGNVLIHGAEIEFVAACCLSFAPEKLKRIYCDTGAITSVAYAMIRLYALFGDERQHATVSSFGSYRQLKEVKFLEAKKCLILISASTSGELAVQLRAVEPRLTPDLILTLFYLSNEAPSGNYLCNLLFNAISNPDGYEAIESYRPDACPLCRDGSTAVPMSGDQFLPEGLCVSKLLLNTGDAPKGLSEFFKDLVGKQLIRTNYGDSPDQSSVHDIFFDLETVFADDSFKDLESWKAQCDAALAHCLSLDTTRLLSLDDPASRNLAVRIQNYCKVRGKDVAIVSASSVTANISQHRQEGGATLVVASAISCGRSLLGVAQTLRHIQVGGGINYIIGLMRAETSDTVRDVRSHLTYGDHGPGEHGFKVLVQLMTASRRFKRWNSWQREYEFLSSLDVTLPQQLRNRREVIAQCASPQIRGLCDNLFLPSVVGVELRLRRGFAFWKFSYSESDVSQGDVYATIATILHSLRHGDHNGRSLGQFDHVRRILSPRCFERFNDGVIQASFLRSAFPSELDYSVDDAAGAEMAEVLRSVFENRDSEIGEAAPEFLLAIATGHLRMAENWIKGLIDDFADASSNEVWQFLWSRVKGMVDTPRKGRQTS
jgi:hypothetical protein